MSMLFFAKKKRKNTVDSYLNNSFLVSSQLIHLGLLSLCSDTYVF